MVYLNTWHCDHYVQIKPATAIDNTDVSALVASVDNFYNDDICGYLTGYSSTRSARRYQRGDTITLPNLSSFTIRFVTDNNQRNRYGWKINLYESTVKFGYKSHCYIIQGHRE